MNRGSQPSVKYFCISSVVILAIMEGTTKGLFIPKVILLTIGNSGMVAGRISFSIMASSSLLTSAEHSFQAGILKISRPSAVNGFKFQNLGYVSMGPSRLPPILHCICPLTLYTISSASFILLNGQRYVVTRGSGNAYVTAGP